MSALNTPNGRSYTRPVVARTVATMVVLLLSTAGGTWASFRIESGGTGMAAIGAPQAQQGDAQAPPAGNSSAASGSSQDQQPAQSPERVTLPAGTTISVRIADAVDSSHGHIGDLLTGTVDPSVLLQDRVVIPRGTEAHVRVSEDKKGGHLHGKAQLELELTNLVMNGRKLEVHSDDYQKKKGAAAAKAEAVANPGAGAAAATAADAALTASPGGAVAAPAIAVFRSAKVEVPAGTRVPFTLTEEFSFDKPPTAQPNSP